jgi:thiol-disulfide isomerase/thioredoxin
MAEVVNKQRQTLNSKIVFVAGNGTKLNTFKDVLALNKGKVVFIDMWGTWCGPCREEIEKNAKQLRDHFQGKNVTFLFIANRDTGREKEWKKQIAYFQMEGENILANSKLTEDIMNKVKGSGYPTYIIIKQDGSYEQTVTKYPVNIRALIKEIEAAGS